MFHGGLLNGLTAASSTSAVTLSNSVRLNLPGSSGNGDYAIGIDSTGNVLIKPTVSTRYDDDLEVRLYRM